MKYLHDTLSSTEISNIKYNKKTLSSSTRQAPGTNLVATNEKHNSETKAKTEFVV
jgi:hypothetical protein